MLKDPSPSDGGTMVLRAGIIILLLTIVMLSISSAAEAEDNRTTRLPITIEGDFQMDTYFMDQSGDGLSWETAYVLEDLEIGQGDDGYCIKINSTTRHLIVRNVLLTAVESTRHEWGIYLDSCENIRIVDCEVGWTGNGIGIEDSKYVIVEGSRIYQMSGMGVYVTGANEVWISDSRLNNSRTGIMVERSRGVYTMNSEVLANDRGIIYRNTNVTVVRESKVHNNRGAGISVENSGTFYIRENTVEWNLIAGIQTSDSTVGIIESNMVSENYRGITLYTTTSTFVDGNNVTRNDILGVRLSSSNGNIIARNNIRSNWNVGLNLVNSFENTVKENNITSHERGIVLSGSRGNTIKENRILANWMAGIDGDVDRNEIRDNEVRANGWLLGLLYLIAGLIALGVVLGVRAWVKRRRLAKDEKDKVLIKRRFPAGAKALWPMSKIMWDEDFFNAQLATAGPQREDILRRYQQNIAAARQMQYMAVGTMAVMLGFMAVLPLLGVMNMVTTDITADNVNDVLFASSMGIAVYYLMSFMILLVFGLLFTSQLMKGDIFKLLSTLPMDDKGARRIVAYLLFRMYGPPLVVVLLAFPVGGFIITWSLPFLFCALLVNGLYLIFVTYVLVLIADSTSRRIFSANASKGATAMRFLIMGGYLMAMMFMFITLDFLTSYISDLFAVARAEGGTGEGINAFISLLPFPFSGPYLISLTMVPGDNIPMMVMATTVAGLAAMGVVVYGMRRRTNYILARVARGVEHAAGGAGQVTTVDQVTIRTKRPRPALMRNGLLVTSRDQGAIMYIIMPLLFPIIFIVPGADRAGAGIYDAVLPFLFYMGMMSFLVNMALSSSDATVGGLMGSLPFKVLDHYRARWMTIVMIMIVPIVIITSVMYGIADEPDRMVAIMVTLVPLVMVLASVYLLTFSLAFGKVNGKYTFFMVKIRMKLAKYVGIIVLQYALVIIELAVFYGLTEADVISFWTGIVGLWAVNLSFILVLELAARRILDWPWAVPSVDNKYSNRP